MAQGARGDNLPTLGRYAEARDLYDSLTRTLTSEGASVQLASLLRRSGAAYHYMGELDRAVERYQSSVASSVAVAEGAGEVEEVSNIGALYLQIGRLEEALAIYERALASFAPEDWPAGTAGLAINLGQVHAVLADRAKTADDTAEFRRQMQAMYRANERAHAQFVELGNRRGLTPPRADQIVSRSERSRNQRRLVARGPSGGDSSGESGVVSMKAVLMPRMIRGLPQMVPVRAPTTARSTRLRVSPRSRYNAAPGARPAARARMPRAMSPRARSGSPGRTIGWPGRRRQRNQSPRPNSVTANPMARALW